jgi:hypothetical protein
MLRRLHAIAGRLHADVTSMPFYEREIAQGMLF